MPLPGRPECDVAGYRHLDRSSHIDAAPDAKLCADSLRALAHSEQAPVAFPARSHCFRVDAAVIIANCKPEVPGGILDFDIDRFRARMTERVNDRFSADAVNFIAEHRVQGPRSSLNYDTKLDGRFGADSELLLNFRECLFEPHGVAIGRP